MASKLLTRRKPCRIKRFWRETTGELKKVSWPTRQEAIQLTKIVIIVMVLVGIVLGGLDLLFSRMFGLLFD